MVHPIVLKEGAINEQEYRINFLHSSLIGVFGGLWICIACRGEGWYLNGWATKFNFELLNIQQIDTAGFCISDLCISLISANGYLSPQCDFFGFLDAIFLFSWIADSFAEPRFGFLSKDSRAPFGQPTNDIN